MASNSLPTLLIDTPSPFAPTKRLQDFVKEMEPLANQHPEAQEALQEARGYLAERDRDSSHHADQ